jgi:radical SAM protein with 4Fe4S-binding SPASM domain
MMKKVYRLKLDAKAKAAKAKIKEVSGGDQFKNLKDWVVFFKENERLPSQKITCASCKTKQTSMFGDNLKRTLPKYGSIEGLLTKFECSDCRKAKAPAKEAKQAKVPKSGKAKAGDINVSGNTVEDYLTVDDIEDRKEKVRATLPKFDPDRKPVKVNFKDQDEVEELTRGTCQRPDIYLDAGCSQCPISQYCIAGCKDMRRKPEDTRKSQGPKRKK